MKLALNLIYGSGQVKKGKALLVLISFITFLMTGCAGESDDQNDTTLYISSKGEITHHIVESFDKSYYNEDELRNGINEQIEEYCKDKGDDSPVKLKELKILDGVATAELTFKDYSDYAAFNEVELFYGTIREAMEANYPTDVTLKSVEDNETIGKYEFEALADNKIIVTGESLLIRTPEKIAYTTANIDVIDKTTAKMASDSVGVGYIVLK